MDDEVHYKIMHKLDCLDTLANLIRSIVRGHK